MNDTVSRECPGCDSEERTGHLRYGRKLEYLTIGWNVVEAGVAIGAGWFAGSIALIGFGVDSVIESLAGLLLNALFGWWWADPVAALIMVPIT